MQLKRKKNPDKICLTDWFLKEKPHCYAHVLEFLLHKEVTLLKYPLVHTLGSSLNGPFKRCAFSFPPLSSPNMETKQNLE